MVSWKCRWCGGWSFMNWDGLDKCGHCGRLRSVGDGIPTTPDPEDGG